jgi:hypothetical protein
MAAGQRLTGEGENIAVPLEQVVGSHDWLFGDPLAL